MSGGIDPDDLGPPVLQVFRFETEDGIGFGTGFDPSALPEPEEAGVMLGEVMGALAVALASSDGPSGDAAAHLETIREVLNDRLDAGVLPEPETLQ